MVSLSHTTLHEGTILYHGTSVAESFEQNGPPKAPAWFSTVQWVAESFVDWRWNVHGPCPRILVYRLTQDIPHMWITTLHNVLLFGARAPFHVCTEWNGWILPDQFQSPNQYEPHQHGNEIMLCDTSTLEFLKRICL